MKTENKIFASARKIFLLYGYHGTTIEKIARDAGISKAMIHYYFRSKDNLYREIVGMIANSLLHYTNFEYPDAHLTWFLVSELRNNKAMFLKIINTKMGKDCEEIIQQLIKRSLGAYSPAEFSEEK